MANRHDTQAESHRAKLAFTSGLLRSVSLVTRTFVTSDWDRKVWGEKVWMVWMVWKVKIPLFDFD